MTLLALLLVANAVLHAMVVIRFGARQNLPYLLYVFIYGGLAVAVFLAVPYVLWAVLGLGLLGLLGLTLTIGKLARDKTLDRVIWLLDIGTIAYAASLLYAALAA
jgi:hypothetical protein